MTGRHVYLFAGAPQYSLAYLKTLDYGGAFLVAVDCGLNVMHELGLVPDLFVGDGDSAAPELVAALDPARTRIASLPTHKDVSDLEAALDLLVALDEKGDVTVLAGLGGRLDHLLFNLLLAARHIIDFHSIRFEDGDVAAEPLTETHLLQLKPGTTVSFVPVTREVELTLIGFAYPLLHALIPEGSTRTLSNVVQDALQQVAVEKGTVIMIVQKLSAGSHE